MRPSLLKVFAHADGMLSKLAVGFAYVWSKLERSYRLPIAFLAKRLGFTLYPLLACAFLGWLAWDWTHTQSLDAAEDAVFDKIVRTRPWEPLPSGKVLLVAIDECSIDYYRSLGEGGWPWSRQRHADLLDALDRGGVKAVGYDVLFVDSSSDDPQGDLSLETMAQAGAGRFIFAADRLNPNYDDVSLMKIVDAPSAFAIVQPPRDNPKVALQLPYGPYLTRYSAIANITRGGDGLLRDIPLREDKGDWALASLPYQLAFAAGSQLRLPPGKNVRPNWRRDTRLPHVSAADLLEGAPICRAKNAAAPRLDRTVAVVGYTASGISDTKPTPTDPIMPGVEVLAEATEALVAGSGIVMPPLWLKYLVASFLIVLTAFAFWRGEPRGDIDSVFAATNFGLLLVSYVGLTFLGTFFDIFASIGLVSVYFGFCRMYAAAQRGQAVGSADYCATYDFERSPWIAMARLRFSVQPGLSPALAKRLEREYKRRLRRFVYGSGRTRFLDNAVESKSRLHPLLDDIVLLVWDGIDMASAQDDASADLGALFQVLTLHDGPLCESSTLMISAVTARINDPDSVCKVKPKARARQLLGAGLRQWIEHPLGDTAFTRFRHVKLFW